MTSTVISFCSLDARFLRHTVTQAGIFSDEVVVTYCDHLLDGTPEDMQAINLFLTRICNQTSVNFRGVMTEWNADKPAKHWHNMIRWAGIQETKGDQLMLLDADEVPDGRKLLGILPMLDPTQAYAFGCYWYFRSACYQAEETERCALLAPRNACTEDALFTSHERYGIDHKMVSDAVFHHYSWVHDLKETMRKVGSWAHKGDRRWEPEVAREWGRPFRGVDFVHGYRFRFVRPFVELGL